MTTTTSSERDPSGKSPHQPGAKMDAGKPLAGEVLSGFAAALEAVIEVGTHGARKYTLDGWKSMDDAERRYTSAMLRHWLAEHRETRDAKSGLTHAAHVAWNALARLHFILEPLRLHGGPIPVEPKDRTSPAAASPATVTDSDPSNAEKPSAGDPRRDTGEASALKAAIRREVDNCVSYCRGCHEHSHADAYARSYATDQIMRLFELEEKRFAASETVRNDAFAEGLLRQSVRESLRHSAELEAKVKELEAKMGQIRDALLQAAEWRGRSAGYHHAAIALTRIEHLLQADTQKPQL